MAPEPLVQHADPGMPIAMSPSPDEEGNEDDESDDGDDDESDDDDDDGERDDDDELDEGDDEGTMHALPARLAAS